MLSLAVAMIATILPGRRPRLVAMDGLGLVIFGLGLWRVGRQLR